MGNVELVHSKRIGARTSPISYTEDGRGCYVWTKTGRTQVVDGIEQVRFSCSGCRAFKLANGGQTVVSSVKYNLTVNEWIGKPEDYQHICQPINVNQIQGLRLTTEYESNQELQKVVRMLGALQITPMLEWDRCLLILRHRITESDLDQETKDKMEELLRYYEKTWLNRREIFCLFGHLGPRTTNHAEAYHSKQRLYFAINSKLGHWAVAFKQLTHTEELDAWDVYEGRQPAKRQRTDSSRITQRLREEKDKLLLFLNTDVGIAREDVYRHQMKKYLTKVGRLMGINFTEFREVLQEDAELLPLNPEDVVNNIMEYAADINTF